jgi:hypothetical protein
VTVRLSVVSPLTDQLRVELPPLVIVFGDALKLARLGAATTVTVTALVVVVPAALVAVRV